MVHLFADEGARLAILDLNADGLEAVAQEVRSVGAQVLPLLVDLSDLEAVQAAVLEVAEHCIEEQDVIPDKAGQALDRILAHLREKEQDVPARPLLMPPTRAPPATQSLFAGSERPNPDQWGRH